MTPAGEISQQPPSGGARRAAHQREHHHGLLRGAHRAGHPGVSRILGAAAVPVRHSSVRLSPSGGSAAVVDQHARLVRGRRGHPARAVRPLERRQDEDGVPPRARDALRPHHAGHIGRAFQLFVSRRFLGCARGHQPIEAPAPGFRLGAVLRGAAQLPPFRLAGAVPVRHLARGIEGLLRGARDQPARARRRYRLRALRHVAAHERHRLSQQESGDGERIGQQPRRVCARSVQGDQHALSAIREARGEGRRRISAAQRQYSADRERVLQLHPAQADRELGRAARPRRCAAPAWNTSRCAPST